MRDDDNSDACDETPRAEDKCYTRGQLRDEFRMKPAPGAEPVRMYKSPYGGKYGVWRLASTRLGLQARMKSERGRCAMQAHTWLALDPVFLDTETTGAQALEIGLVNACGERIFETRLKPTVDIDPAAAAVHGISDDDLVSAPSWPDIAQQLQHHIGRRPLVIFNAEFDTRILKQTAAAHNDPASWLDSLTVYCAMRLAAGYYGPTNRYGTISLSGAVSQAGLSWSGEAHSAVTDAVMTAQVVNNIAGYWHELQCEVNDGAGSEPA